MPATEAEEAMILDKLKAHRYCIAAVALAAGGGYAAGRFSAPTKVIETTKIEWKDRIVTKEVIREVRVSGPVRVQEKIVERPGVDRVIERVIERGPTTTTTGTDSTSDATHSGTSETVKIVERDRPQWAADLGAQWTAKPLTLKPSDLDAGLGRRILGPVWLSVTATAPTGQLGDLGAYRFGLRARVEF